MKRPSRKDLQKILLIAFLLHGCTSVPPGAYPPSSAVTSDQLNPAECQAGQTTSFSTATFASYKVQVIGPKDNTCLVEIDVSSESGHNKHLCAIDNHQAPISLRTLALDGEAYCK